LSIRTATEIDLETVLEIYNDSVAHTTATFDLEPRSLEAQRSWLAEHVPPHPVIVREEQGRVLGWGSISTYSSRPAYRFTGEVSVYVAAVARRQGIGEALLRELILLACQNDLHTLVARITQDNEPSIRLAEKTGFVRVGLLEEVGFKFERWLNVAIYQKRCDT
jgi:L-amino acid N-acyltransferase YncA